MKHARTCFIGGGNMARSLIGGLIANGVAADTLVAADPDPQQRAGLTQAFGIVTYPENAEAAKQADIVVLAVKPQVLRQAAQAIASALRGRDVLIISIVAGIREVDLRRWLGDGTAIVRVMPNTPALLGCGVSALFANQATSASQRDRAESIMRAVGAALWMNDESLLDAVTAVSGSGPAYFFLFMELIAAGGRRLGLDEEAARLLTVETALGAARMALETDDDLPRLRQQVTSPGGTTAAALDVLDTDTLRDLIDRALHSAHARSMELARQYGRD